MNCSECGGLLKTLSERSGAKGNQVDSGYRKCRDCGKVSPIRGTGDDNE